MAGAIPPDSAGDELGRGLGKVEERLGKMLARGARRMVARDGRGGDGGGSVRTLARTGGRKNEEEGEARHSGSG